MENMINREVFDYKSAVEQLKQKLAVALEPPLSDLALLPELSSFLDAVLTEYYKSEKALCERNTRQKVKIFILLYLYSPEYIVYNGFINKRKGIVKAIARSLNLSLSALSLHKKEAVKRYKRYGGFALLVDSVYDKVSEHYNLQKK